MIIQNLLNLVTGWIAGWLQSIPPLPADLLAPQADQQPAWGRLCGVRQRAWGDLSVHRGAM